MSIINIRTRTRTWRMSVVRRSKGCLRVERNREGVLYFRQPKGDDYVTTWHIYASGERLLSQAGVIEGTCLGRGLLKQLRTGGHLYTQNGMPPAKSKYSKPSTSKDSQSSNGPKQGNPPQVPPTTGKKKPSAKALRKAEEKSRRAAAIARVEERISAEKAQEAARKIPVGDVVTELKAPSEPKPKRKPNPHPVQRTFSWGFGLRDKRKLEKRKQKSRPQPSKTHPNGSAGRPRSSVHPGWLTPLDFGNSNQDSTDEQSL